jgi:hypothetical protein
MNAPDFIRVGGVLYRARSSQKRKRPILAALPHVLSIVNNAISSMQRVLHDANVGEADIEKLRALQDTVSSRKDYALANRLWANIQSSVLALTDELDGEAKRMFGRAALGLDDALSALLKTKGAAAPVLPPYITVGTQLYRLRR